MGQGFTGGSPVSTSAEDGEPPPPARGDRIALRWFAFIIACIVVTAFGVVAVSRPWWARADFVDGPASALGGAPAVRVAYAYVDGSGRESGGAFTVTEDGYATGTITDPHGGTAAFASTPDGPAVYGDARWWLRRSPGQVAELRDRWVRPDEGVAFPVRPDTALRPSAVAALVYAVSEAGAVVADDGDPDALTLVSGAWTLRLSETVPRRVVSLAGPVEAGRVRPAADSGGGATFTPLGLAGDTGASYAEVDAGGDGFLVLSPEPEDREPADKARSDASATMSGRGTTPPGMSTPSPSSSPDGNGPPPAQGDLPPQQPEFAITYDLGSGPCVTRTCSWSVTVANDGTVAGRAFVTLVESPGSTHGPFDLGVIEPGESADSPVVSHRNQAIGTGKAVTVSLEARLFSPDVNAPKEKLNRVYKKGVPAEAVWEVLARVSEHADEVLDIMIRMLDAGAPPAKVPEAVDNVIDWEMLPNLTALLAPGARAKVWKALAEKLGGAGANEEQLRGYLRELYFAIDELNAFPERTITLDTPVREDGRLKTSDVVSEPADPGGEKRCYQVKSVSQKGIILHLNKAVGQLNGDSATAGEDPVYEEALKDCTALVRMYVEASSPLWHRDAEGLIAFFAQRRGDITLCGRPDKRFDGLIVTTGAGTFTLTRDDICG